MVSERIIGRNYLLGTKVAFLIISFIIVIFGLMVQNDIWPIVQTTIPLQVYYTKWFWLSALIGLVLPTTWLWLDWSIKPVRYGLISFLCMYILQGLTEVFVAKYFFMSMVIPTSILYVGYRLVQLASLQRILLSTSYPINTSKMVRGLVVIGNLCFWTVLWCNSTFIVFPHIIYQFF